MLALSTLADFNSRDTYIPNTLELWPYSSFELKNQLCYLEIWLDLGWFVWDSIWRLFRMQASRQSVKTHYSFDSIGSSLSTGFQVYLSKWWDPYVSPGCSIRLVFFCSLSALFQYVDLVTTSLRAGFQVYLS